MSDKNIILRDYLSQTNIFTLINNGGSFPFITGSESILNTGLIINYGSRNLFSAFKDVAVRDVADLIVKLYSDKWDKLLTSIDSISNYGAESITKTTETVKDIESKNGKTDSLNKVSAFNSDELVVDTGNDSTSDENSNKNMDRAELVEKFNQKTLFDNLPLVEQTNIINLVTRDIVKYLTIDIY